MDERQLRVVYGDIFPLTCPSGYQIDSGQCRLVGACPQAEPEVCEDGYPPEAGEAIGYGTTCDRPDVQQCEDGSFVEAEGGICPIGEIPQTCTDYSDCYSYALANSSCSSAEYFNFDYQDPNNWTFSCTDIDPVSPDHPDNNGNGDGNPYNDPNTPDSGEGSIANTSDIDPQSLAGFIGDELEGDLSNIERAIRDDLNQSIDNTEQLESAINSLSNQNQDGFSNIEGAIRDGIISGQSSAESIRQSIDTLGAQLSQSEGGGPCDPTQPDYYSCLDTPLSNLPSHTQSEASTFSEANANFKGRLDNSPLVQSFSGMSNIISLDNGQCPEFSIDFPAPINETVSTQIHCDLMQTIAPIISTIMLIIYTWLAFRIFASA